MGYCFYCDRQVDTETCPTCGRQAWVEPDTQPQPVQETEPAEPPVPLARMVREQRPWLIVAGVVVVGLILSILTVPSGFQHVTTPTPPPLTTTTSSTIPDPEASLPVYVMASGTWIGIISDKNPPQTLTGSFPFLEPAVDVLPDGSMIVERSDGFALMSTGGIETPLPIGSPGSYDDVALAPNGRDLALLDTEGNVSVYDIPSGLTIDMTPGITIDMTPGTRQGPFEDGLLMWSPDSALIGLSTSDTSSFWTVAGDLLTVLGGRLVALSNQATAYVTDGRLAIGTSISSSDYTEIQSAAFDPTGRYLAIEATAASNGEDGGPGVWIIDIPNGSRELVAPPSSVYAWSGDGSALYWADGTGTYAFPTASIFRQAKISVDGSRSGDRLRVYDSSFVPLPTVLIRPGSLFELRDGVVYRRGPRGSDEVPTEGLTLAIADGSSYDPAHPLLRTAEYDDGSRKVSLVDEMGNAQPLASLPAEVGPVTAILNVPGTGLFLETSDDQILTYDFTSSSSTTTGTALMPLLSGHSIGLVGNVPFAVTDTAIVHLPRTADAIAAGEAPPAPETLIGIGDLPGAGVILDAIGIGSDLIVLAKTNVDTAVLFFIPGDSELFDGAVVPNAPSPNPTPLSVVTSDINTVQIDSGEIVDAGDGGTFVVNLDTPNGPWSSLFSALQFANYQCGAAVVCGNQPIPLRALGFTENGAWLVTTMNNALMARSTRGRGAVSLSGDAPGQIVWVP
jgi:hypothetical protein